MKKYRPKPKPDVEACQFTGSARSFHEIQDWLGKNIFYYDYQEHPRVFLNRTGIEKGWWIVKLPDVEIGEEHIVMRDDQFRSSHSDIE